MCIIRIAKDFGRCSTSTKVMPKFSPLPCTLAGALLGALTSTLAFFWGWGVLGAAAACRLPFCARHINKSSACSADLTHGGCLVPCVDPLSDTCNDSASRSERCLGTSMQSWDMFPTGVRTGQTDRHLGGDSLLFLVIFVILLLLICESSNPPSCENLHHVNHPASVLHLQQCQRGSI